MKNYFLGFIILTMFASCKNEKTFRPISRFQLHGQVKKITFSKLDKPTNTEVESGTEWYRDGNIDSSNYTAGDDRIFTKYEYQNNRISKSTVHFKSSFGDTLTLTYLHRWESEYEVTAQTFIKNEQTDEGKNRYDKYGRLELKESNSLKPDSYNNYATTYRYVGDTVRIHQKRPGKPDKIQFSVFSNYDSKGNPQTETTYQGNAVTSITTYRYTYN